MKYPKTERFDKDFVQRHLMGPNCLKLLEELTQDLSLPPGARILDLGCGMGLTSMFLAKEYGARVFACDLWISATENHQRFMAHGDDGNVIPLHTDANELPFAGEYFDAVISVDAYHYFGRVKGFFSEKIFPLVKVGGVVAIAVPGLRRELTEGAPEAMLRSWTEEDIGTMPTAAWWRGLLEAEAEGCALDVMEMESFEEPWQDWLSTDNPYAVGDRAAMEAGAGEYMNFVSIVARKP